MRSRSTALAFLVAVAAALTGPSLAAADNSSAIAGPVAAGAAWSSNFSTGNFRQWSWWGQGQQSIWGNIAVVKAASAGIPALTRGDDDVAQMTVTASGAAQGKVNAKLYKGFATRNRDGVTHEPANVSGTYSAWYYIPSSYRIHGTDWANIFQFKEQYQQPDGSDYSVPLWWVQLGSASWAKEIGNARWIGPRPRRADQPVAFLNEWGNDWKRRVTLEAVPLNRWFEITSTIYDKNRAVYSIDGKPFDVALASQYPVSPFRATGNEWIFGVGNYATAPGTTLYVGKAGYQASHAAIAARAQAHRAQAHG
jgi:hypothetical protein